MCTKTPPLFSQGDLDAYLSDKRGRLRPTVMNLTVERVKALDDERLADEVCGMLRMEHLELLLDRAEMEPPEDIEVDGKLYYRDRYFGRDSGPWLVAGTRLTVSVPFEGDPVLWSLRPNPRNTRPPSAQVQTFKDGRSPQIQVVIEQPSEMGMESIRNSWESIKTVIVESVRYQRKQVDNYNSWLKANARKEIKERRERLGQQDGLPGMLGIPLKRRPDAPDVRPSSVRRIERPLPVLPIRGSAPERGITTNDYEHIVNVIRHSGRMFERAPDTFSVHDEEGLRDIILASLCTHYEKTASGEAFRRKGKTDILIEDAERCAFVAECKVWKGAKNLPEAIDQLMSYLTWRDCKACIVVFNKNVAAFSDILVKAHAAACEHPQFERVLAAERNGEWRLTFRAKDDPTRHVIVTFLVFDVRPTSGDEPET